MAANESVTEKDATCPHGVHAWEHACVVCGQEPTPYESAQLLDALRQDRAELLVALRKLANEASGFWALADTDTHGHTNMSVLRMRIDEAFAAIRRTEGGA